MKRSNERAVRLWQSLGFETLDGSRVRFDIRCMATSMRW